MGNLLGLVASRGVRGHVVDVERVVNVGVHEDLRCIEGDGAREGGAMLSARPTAGRQQKQRAHE